MTSGDPADGDQNLSLAQATEHLLEECRMVLPGIQALFGFQLMAVFNRAFDEKLTTVEQHLHLLAVMLVVVAIALVMAPAAYDRQTGLQKLSRRFVDLSSRLLLWSMFPLALGLCTDFYLIARVITQSPPIAMTLTVLLLGVLAGCWLLLPRLRSNAK